MPFITIAGIEVLVTELSEREPELIGDVGRSYDGTWRGDTSGEIRAWRGTALEVAASDYHALRSAVRRGTVEVQGDAIYGGWSRTMRVTLAGTYVRDGANYLIVPGFTMEDAGVLDLAYLLAPDRTSGWTLSRASTATQIGETGLIETVAVDILRDEHYVDGERAVLLELARTNLILWSEALDNAAWTLSGSPVVTANDAIAPDGATTADKVEDDNATAQEAILQGVTVANDSLRSVGSVFVKKRSGGPIPALQVQFTGGTTVSAVLQIDPETGDIHLESGTPAHYGVEDAGDFWRLWIALANNSSGNTTFRPILIPARTSVLGNAAENTATGYHHFWGVQVEGAPGVLTSYIKTESATATRAVDALSRALPTGTSLPSDPFARYTRFKPAPGDWNITNRRILHIGGGSGGRLLLYMPTPTSIRLRHANGTTTDDADVTVAIEVGSAVEVAVIWNGDGTGTLIASVDGGTPVSDTLAGIAPASAWSEATAYINSGSSGGDAGAMAVIRDAIKPGVPVGGTAEEHLLYMRGEAA